MLRNAFFFFLYLNFWSESFYRIEDFTVLVMKISLLKGKAHALLLILLFGHYIWRP